MTSASLCYSYTHICALALLTNSDACSVCATSKHTGKLSCCASGGSWYKKCGSPGDTRFYHTWVDGIQACNSFARQSSSEASARAFAQSHYDFRPLNTTRTRGVTTSPGTTTDFRTQNPNHPLNATGPADVTESQEITRPRNVTSPRHGPRSQRTAGSQDTAGTLYVTPPQEVTPPPQEVTLPQEFEQQQTLDWVVGGNSYARTTDTTGRVKLAKLAACVSLSFIIFSHRFDSSFDR